MKKVAAIVGGGVIGAGWLARFLLNGWDVKVFDPDPEARRKVEEVLLNAKRALPMLYDFCLLYTSPSPRDVEESRMPSSA